MTLTQLLDEQATSVGHPEIPVIGALVGGFLLAKLLRALRGGG